MPTHEPLAPSLIPQKAAPEPIPTITVKTRPNVPKQPQVASPSETAPQPSTTETQAAASALGAAESVQLTPQASALARKEQAYRQREQALKQRETDLADKLQKAEQYSQLMQKIQAKDYSAAEQLGIDYEGYTAHQLSKQESESPEQAAVKALQSEVTSIKQEQEAKATREYEATVAEYQTEIANAIASNPEFSSIKELKREDAVLQLILDSWEEDDKMLTVEQAAKDIEDFLVAEATKMAALPKVRKEVPEAKPLPKPSLKTLTQQVTVGANAAPTKSLMAMSESERYAEARRRVIARREGK